VDREVRQNEDGDIRGRCAQVSFHPGDIFFAVALLYLEAMEPAPRQ
jgi:hypothetical protein